MEASQVNGDDTASVRPSCGQGGSGYFTSVTMRIYQVCPLRSGPSDLWDLSLCGNPASQEICTHTGAP